MALADLNNVLRVFGMSALSGDDQQELFREVLLMTLARASSSDANIDPVEISTIQRIVKRELDVDLSETDVRRAARTELYESESLRRYLRSVRRHLSDENRVTIIRALAEVIKSDTTISVLEVEWFNRVSEALRVTPAEIAGLSSS